MPKMRQRDYFQASFCYLKKTLNEVKASALQQVLKNISHVIFY